MVRKVGVSSKRPLDFGLHVMLLGLFLVVGQSLAQVPVSTTLPPPTGRIQWHPSQKDPPQTGTIAGMVLDVVTKRPKAGATVHLLHPLVVTQEQQRFAVRTDREGRFQFEQVPIGRVYAIYAVLNDRMSFGHINQIDLVKLDEDKETTAKKLVLLQTNPLKFQFVERDSRKPLGGVQIALKRLLLEPLAKELIPFKPIPSIINLGSSNAQGKWTTGFLSGEFTIVFVKENYVPARRRIVMQNPSAEPLVFEMEKGGALQGTVSDIHGRPLANAIVLLGDRQVAATDKNGHYGFTGLPLDEPSLLIFMCAGFKTRNISGVSFPLFAGTKTLDVTLEPQPPKALNPHSGAVDKAHQNRVKGLQPIADTLELKFQFFDPKGQPLENATVQYQSGSQVLQTKTGVNGQSRIKSEHANHLRFKFFAQGYSVKQVTANPSAFQKSQQSIRIDFEEARTYRGRLLDRQKKPIAGAEVHCQFPSGAYWHFWRGAPFVTDAEGRFAIDHVTPEFSLEMKADGYQTKKITVDEISSIEKVLTLTKPGFFRGQVVDAQGLPVTEFRAFLLGDLDVHLSSLKGFFTVRDTQGMLEVRNLAENKPFRIFIASSQHPGKVFGPFLPETDPEAKRPALHLEGEITSLKGRVLESSGAPIANAIVWGAVFDSDTQPFIQQTREDPLELRRKSLARFSTRTNQEGTFVLENIPEGLDMSLYFFAEGRATMRIRDLKPNTKLKDLPLEVMLPKAASILVQAEPEQFPNAHALSLYSGNSRLKTVEVFGELPPWRIEAVGPGSYQLNLMAAPASMSASPEVLLTRKVDVSEGKEVLIDLASEKGNAFKATLAGVAYRGEDLMVNANLWLYLGDSRKGGRQTTTDANGRFSFGETIHGQYQLYILAQKRPRHLEVLIQQSRKRFVVVDHQRAEDYELRFPKALARLHGQVSKYRPTSQFQFKSYDQRWQIQNSYVAELDPTKRFEVRAEPGSYQVALIDYGSYALYFLAEGIEVNETSKEVDLGTLALEPTNGFQLRLDGVPADFGIVTLSLDLFREEQGQFQDLKHHFRPFLGIKDGLLVTGLPSGTYVLNIVNRFHKSPFQPSWQKKTIQVVAGKHPEVRLGISMRTGCLVEVMDHNLTLDTITFIDPKTLTQVHVSEYDDLAFSNRVRLSSPKPGTWLMQASTKEGPSFSKTVTIPAKGGVQIQLDAK